MENTESSNATIQFGVTSSVANLVGDCSLLTSFSQTIHLPNALQVQDLPVGLVSFNYLFEHGYHPDISRMGIYI
jgi:hypothetical protein